MLWMIPSKLIGSGNETVVEVVSILVSVLVSLGAKFPKGGPPNRGFTRFGLRFHAKEVMYPLT